MTQRIMKIVDNPKFNEILGPVRNEVLQKLMLLLYAGINSKELGEKALGIKLSDAPTLRNDLQMLVEALKPEHVMPLLNVSKRTSYEYIRALQWIVAMCFF